MVRVIVLDLDDTLYLEREYAFSGFAAAGRFFQETRGIPGLADCAGALFAGGERQNIYDLALRSLGIAPESALIKELVDVHRGHKPAIRLCADAKRFVGRSARAGFSLAILSDGWLRAQERKLEALSLSEKLDPIVLTDRWGRQYWKPCPRGFETIMARHGGAPAEYIYIADNPMKDFVAPRKLGWRTLRIRRADGEHARREAATPDAAAESETSTLDALDLAALAAGCIDVSTVLYTKPEISRPAR